MKIYALLGHPDTESFNARILNAYVTAAEACGHEVRVQKLGELQFDPVLWHGYRQKPPLEPDLVAAQENILWCERWVIVYPIWWGTLPALLKGFIDRTLYSGFAYKYHKHDPLWDKLLAGRSAHLITTCDAPSWWIFWRYRNSDLNALKRATLEFCGIKPVRVLRLDRIRFRLPAQEEQLLARVRQLAQNQS